MTTTLYKAPFTKDGIQQRVWVLSQDTDDVVAPLLQRTFPGVQFHDIDYEQAWSSLDRDGLTVQGEEDALEFPEPILSDDKITVWGTQDAARLLAERQWIIHVDAQAYGPYSDRELRVSILEELSFTDQPEDSQLAEWRAMPLDRLITKLDDATMGDVRVADLQSPGDGWRARVASGEFD